MTLELPPRPRNRIAVLRVIAFALLGTLILAGLVADAILTAPEAVFAVPSASLPSAMERWGFDVSHLLLTMPLGAVIVLFSRVVIGIDTFGIFTPMLMALAFLQLGPVLGPASMGGTILIGALIVPVLDRFNITRMGMMAVLIGIVAWIQFALQSWFGGALLDTSFPVVVSALVVERWWITTHSEGALEAGLLACATVLLAIIIQFALAGSLIRAIVSAAPFFVPVIAIIAALLLSRYRGLRLSEFDRFTTVLEEERGPARN